MTLQEIRQNQIEYCRDHIEYFIDTYGHIEDKDAEEIIQPFHMWDAQREALRSIATHKLNVILKARQLGFSWLVLHYAAHLLVTMEGRTCIALSQKEDDAKELVRRFGVILKNMPELIAEDSDKPTGWSGATYTQTALRIEITFPSGLVSVFNGMPSAPGAGRSFTANLIILDEWAFQQYAEQIWTAGYPTINRPTGGQVIGLSTIDRGSFFEEVFTNPDNGFNKIFIPWYADPRRDDNWYSETKKAMGELMTQEYPATVEEALTVPGGSYFPEVNERNTVSYEDLNGNTLKYVAIDYGLDMFAAHWVRVDSFGNAQVYREYDKSGLTISEAAGTLLSMCEEETIEAFLAPPDLWNRSQETGKSRAQIWSECGVDLTKTSNDFAAGCSGMKEWLKPQGENKKSKLTILDGCAPNLYRCLKKIQKDKKRPNVYAKDPHDLTHDPDSLRYFCVWWTIPADSPEEIDRRRNNWRPDLLEDYETADNEIRAMMVKKYGEPYYEDV